MARNRRDGELYRVRDVLTRGEIRQIPGLIPLVKYKNNPERESTKWESSSPEEAKAGLAHSLHLWKRLKSDFAFASYNPINLSDPDVFIPDYLKEEWFSITNDINRLNAGAPMALDEDLHAMAERMMRNRRVPPRMVNTFVRNPEYDESNSISVRDRERADALYLHEFKKLAYEYAKKEQDAGKPGKASEVYVEMMNHPYVQDLQMSQWSPTIDSSLIR